MIVVIGQPGSGKSAFALNWAVRLYAPTLLLSLDTDLPTQAVRAAAIHSGHPMEQVRRDVAAWSLYIGRYLSHVRAYDLYLPPQQLQGLVAAETEYWGAPPALTVVDNVANLIKEGGYEEYRRIFTELHRVARSTGTCLVALHHVTRSAPLGRPLTLASGQYAGEQEAEVVLGLWNDQPGVLNVSTLKNRNGEADPSGSLYTRLRFDRNSMRIEEVGGPA